MKKRLYIGRFLLPLLYAGFAICLCKTPASADPVASWEITELHDGQDPSINIDSSGNPRLSFGKNDGSTSYPTHIFYSFHANGTWDTSEIVSKPKGCAETSIFIDTAGKAHIAYAIEWGQGVWYNTNAGGGWSEFQIKPPWTGNYVSMTRDSSGNIHAVYWNNNDFGDLQRQLHYRCKDGAAWQPAEGLGSLDIKIYNTYTRPAAVFVGNETPAVPHVIAGINTGGLKHYYRSGGTWQSEYFGTGYDILDDPSGAALIDNTGNLYCVLSKSVGGSKWLYLAKRSGSQWSYASIIQLSSGSMGRAALAADSNNDIHITYFSGQVLYYGMRSGTTWVFEEVAAIPGGTVPEDISIVLNSAGCPKIAYSTSNPGKIYYAEEVINNPPVVESIPDQSVCEGDTFIIDVIASDPDGDNLEYYLEAISGKAYPDGMTIDSATGVIEWTPAYDQAGSFEAGACVSDGRGGEDSEVIAITVTDTNRSPVMIPEPPFTVDEGELLEFDIAAFDPDGDELIYLLEPVRGKTYPAGASVDESAGTFEWQTESGRAGVYQAKLKVCDDKGAEDVAALQITVGNASQTVVEPGRTIQNVIDDPERPFDVIFIPAGTYSEDITIDEDITLIGEPAHTTILKGGIRVISANPTIDSLTIWYNEGEFFPFNNGYYMDMNIMADAGITAINSGLTVKDCIIRPDEDYLDTLPGDDNTVKHYGKGIQIWNMYQNPDIAPRIENNVIQNAGCAVYYFTQSYSGAAEGWVKNNTFYNNSHGILLRMHNESPEIKNNIITGGDDGVYFTYRDGERFEYRKAAIHHNDVWGGVNTYWLDESEEVFELTGTSGNISYDPMFTDADGGDFTLYESSPCRGAADDGGDMGARIEIYPPPDAPTIEPLPSFTNEQFINISGTKGINTSVLINGVELVPMDGVTEWVIPSYDLGSEGAKTLVFTSKDTHGQESDAVIHNITLDMTPPNVAITAPLDGAELNEAPITVTGTIDDPAAYVDVNGNHAEIEGDNFTAEGVDLKYGTNTLVATAADEAGNAAAHTITVDSSATSIYELIKVTPDIYEDDPDIPAAGSAVNLTVKLLVENGPAADEPIEFTITNGGGTLSQPVVNTDANGEATAVLTTDTNSLMYNGIEAYAQNFPDKKVEFYIATKAGPPAQLFKLTDETMTPVPGATIPLIVKLMDAHNNLIEGEEINFTVTYGVGTLSATTAQTNYYGEADVGLTLANTPGTSVGIMAFCVSNPALFVIFELTTSAPLTLTFDEIIGSVRVNDAKITDLMCDIVTSSNDPVSAPEKHFKLWQKGNKAKVEYTLPEHKTFVTEIEEGWMKVNGVPFLAIGEEAGDPSMVRSDVVEGFCGTSYVLRTTLTLSTGSEEISRFYIDYNRGVVIKTQNEYRDDHKKEFIEISYSYILIDDAWVVDETVTIEQDFVKGSEYTTCETRSNIIINSGIPDSVFQ